ncbi:RING-H2 finger protein ATL74-like [Zingiber officinale]|uniref:RING-type domain-containing protein n=1 Tax=Zingiber officinale TaxID=94328 RepID=A0A8J5L2I8_ZINOF|nr:RING-H2 finger protein ATL74-like [Zingiber officinale]XP_042392976.1 RING-H2 finger protein ATL74-like [Zingiber officinale]KAG6502962.1 hypothetical protein ZIOFF_035251 [Zingiber officinale]
MVSPGLNLVMTVIGFAVSIMFIVFVCTRLICARIHLRRSRTSLPDDAARSELGIASSYSIQRGIHGLEPITVSSFPTKKFGDLPFSCGQETQCTVCLADYQEKDVLRILPFCGHNFHVICIDIWLKQHSTCPVCRISLRDSPDSKRTLQPLYCPSMRPFSPPEAFVSDPCRSQFAESGFSSSATELRRSVPPQDDYLV